VYVLDVLPAESAKAAQASLERKVARLQQDLDTRSKALNEVSRALCGSCMHRMDQQHRFCKILVTVCSLRLLTDSPLK
jgi:hypothetical protein